LPPTPLIAVRAHIEWLANACHSMPTRPAIGYRAASHLIT